MTFSHILKNLRDEKKVTQRQLGEAIGKSSRVISYYENEQSANNFPDSETLSKIANYFGVTVDYLIGVQDQRLTAKMELVQLLIDLTSNGSIAWEQVAEDTTVPFDNAHFFYQKPSDSSKSKDEGARVYDGLNLKDSFTVAVRDKVYLLYQTRPTEGAVPGEHTAIYLSVFTGSEADDILTMTNQESNHLLQDLLEIVDNSINNNENKILRALLDDLNSLSDAEDGDSL
ncbi:MAG: helix-turn-helix transcriptional regulator [Peptoniphilus sp.]|nr:helix-turn-helix transcriptional regulator [Peptoniphilus sp.]MDY6045177.1 helix-turn-helix transcriptional regulator [Peptoniphilus sp.]